MSRIPGCDAEFRDRRMEAFLATAFASGTFEWVLSRKDE